MDETVNNGAQAFYLEVCNVHDVIFLMLSY